MAHEVQHSSHHWGCFALVHGAQLSNSDAGFADACKSVQLHMCICIIVPCSLRLEGVCGSAGNVQSSLLLSL